MTTVAECATADEALVLQSLLEACGVKAFLPDALTVSYPPIVGSIHVQVADEDAETARSVLANNAP
jgi:Putative prokaryotic signal transducing protein